MRIERSVDAEAVALTWTDVRQVAMPDVVGRVRQRDAGFDAVLVEQAHVDRLGRAGEQREVRAFAVPRRTERRRVPWPLVRHDDRA